MGAKITYTDLNDVPLWLDKTVSAATRERAWKKYQRERQGRRCSCGTEATIHAWDATWMCAPCALAELRTRRT